MVHVQPLVVVHQLMQSSPVGRGRGELGDKNNQIADEEDEDVVHDDHHTTTKVKYQNYPSSDALTVLQIQATNEFHHF